MNNKLILKIVVLIVVISTIIIPNYVFADYYMSYTANPSQNSHIQKISVNKAGSWIIETDKNYTTTCDTVLTLCCDSNRDYTLTDDEVMFEDDDGRNYGAYSKINAYLNPGEYYIVVREYNSSNNVNCLVTIKEAVNCSNINVGEYKTVNSIYSDYKFSVSSTSKYKIETSFDTQSNADTYLFLYDNSHNVIAYNDDSSGSYSKIEYTLKPGNYFIRVRSYYSGQSVNCKLKVTNLGSSTLPSVNILEPSFSNGYFLKGNTFTIRAYSTSGSPVLYYQGHEETSRYWQVEYTNGYKLNWTPDFWSRPYQGYMPNIRLAVNSGNSYSYSEKPAYVTMATLQEYKNTDPGFTYNSPTSNRFRGLATGHANLFGEYGTYNCLAYALGYTDHWEWDWPGRLPTSTELINYMDSNGYNLYLLQNCDVIYYENGHFAKVVARDATGTPTKIYSKWGGQEVIESNGYNPFASGDAYGDSIYYFKKR